MHLAVSEVKTTSMPASRRAHFEKVLSDLEKAEAREIKGKGLLKAVTIWSDLK
jgi:hypothetical protein